MNQSSFAAKNLLPNPTHSINVATDTADIMRQFWPRRENSPRNRIANPINGKDSASIGDVNL